LLAGEHDDVGRGARERAALDAEDVLEAARVLADGDDGVVPFERGAEDGIPERERLSVAASNSAFAFLDDPREDVYGPEDGEAFCEEDCA
jgi:hypothetical protein